MKFLEGIFTNAGLIMGNFVTIIIRFSKTFLVTLAETETSLGKQGRK
jgi:hypothetical protein